MQRYGPISYYTLGRVFPRDYLRQGYFRAPFAGRMMSLRDRTFVAVHIVPKKPMRGGFYGRFF